MDTPPTPATSEGALFNSWLKYSKIYYMHMQGPLKINTTSPSAFSILYISSICLNFHCIINILLDVEILLDIKPALWEFCHLTGHLLQVSRTSDGKSWFTNESMNYLYTAFFISNSNYNGYFFFPLVFSNWTHNVYYASSFLSISQVFTIKGYYNSTIFVRH